MRAGRLLGVFAVLVIMISAGQLGARAAGGTTVGPVQISVLGHPRLCWQAGGNGSAVTLERCDRMLQGQQWSLTPDGVLMNGNGYIRRFRSVHPRLVRSRCAIGQLLWSRRKITCMGSVAAAHIMRRCFNTTGYRVDLPPQKRG